jgi:hypothetical protein
LFAPRRFISETRQSSKNCRFLWGSFRGSENISRLGEILLGGKTIYFGQKVFKQIMITHNQEDYEAKQMKKQKVIIPEIPLHLVFEYNFSEILMRNERTPEIVSLKIDDRNILPGELELLSNEPNQLFNRDELLLFRLGIFGIERVVTSKGVYDRVGKPSARLDDLGERGDYYQIVTVEYQLKPD